LCPPKASSASTAMAANSSVAPKNPTRIPSFAEGGFDFMVNQAGRKKLPRAGIMSSGTGLKSRRRLCFKEL